jgi:DNA methylase
MIDPLYGLPTTRQTYLQSAEMSSAELYAFYRGALDVLRSCSGSDACIFAFTGWRNSLEFLTAARLGGFPSIHSCVWIKTHASSGALYRNLHELVHLLGTGNELPERNAELRRYGRTRADVWEYRSVTSVLAGRDALLAYSPGKPVRLLTDAIRDITKRGDVAFDTFLGSGSTLVAAAETGRICIGIERDPRLVDAATQRCNARPVETPS